MAFKRSTNPRSFELTSLIDIVFLLLIFFLVSFAFSLAGDVSESKIYSEMDLPKTDTELPVIREDKLENLMIQIAPDTTHIGNGRLAYILWPSDNDSTTISRIQAYRKAVKDSTVGVFPDGFTELPSAEFGLLPVCTLISNSIERYVQRERARSEKIHPIVEVRADKNTEFRIINFIMETCGAYQDLIPQIVIRTTP